MHNNFTPDILQLDTKLLRYPRTRLKQAFAFVLKNPSTRTTTSGKWKLHLSFRPPKGLTDHHQPRFQLTMAVMSTFEQPSFLDDTTVFDDFVHHQYNDLAGSANVMAEDVVFGDTMPLHQSQWTG